jgi:AraC family transcriptional regulator
MLSGETMSWLCSLRVGEYAGPGAMAPHAHERDSLSFPLGGFYVERICGRETGHRLGDILFYPAGEMHSQLFERRTHTLMIAPCAEARDRLASRLRLSEAPHGRARRLGAIALRLAEEARRPDSQSELIAQGLVFEAIGLFARHEDKADGPSAWLERARAMVLEAEGSVSLSRVASEVGRSAGTVAAAYRRRFGCTIGTDARAARLDRAARLLASTRRPIAEIAAECGYCDQAHLTRAFRTAFGLAPGAYRKALH